MNKIKSSKNKNIFVISRMNTIKDFLFSVLILIFMTIIISNPSRFNKSTINGVKLFWTAVFPGLFAFMFLTKLLTEIGFLFKISNKFNNLSNKLFGTNGLAFYAFIMSILSGYPIGAKIISEIYNKGLISNKEAKRLSLFCTTSGPIFIIGAVGIGMFKSFKIGLILYLSHIISSLILGILYNLIKRNKSCESFKNLTFEKQENIFSLCITGTINSIMAVGAYITIFYLLTDVLDYLKIIDFISGFFSMCFSKFGLSPSLSKPICYGILEVTRGCRELSVNFSLNTIPIVCSIISFSGISIIMQSLMFLKDAKIKAHTFISFKCVHMIFSFLICKLLILFI